MQTTERRPAKTGKDIGLLFKPDMIRALLRDESPKTQTRRIIAPQPIQEGGFWVWKREGKASSPLVNSPLMLSKAPYQVGDRIYAKESMYNDDNCWRYTTDDALVLVDKRYETDMICWAHHKDTPKHSALFMPKFAARIWRTVTDVRVQRLCDISREDAIAEGIGRGIVHQQMFQNYAVPLPAAIDISPKDHFSDPRDSFRTLWNSINGKWIAEKKGGAIAQYACYPWAEEDAPEKPLHAIRKDIPCVVQANPWLWCISFATEFRDGGEG